MTLAEKIARQNLLKERFLDSSLSLFERNVMAVEKAFLQSVIDFLSQVRGKGGIIPPTPANLNFMVQSIEQLNRQLRESGYDRLIGDYLTGVDDVIRQVKATLEITGIERAFLAKDFDIIKIIQQGIDQKFAVIGERAVADIVDQLMQGVLSNASFKDMVGLLSDSIVGTDVRGGLLTRYTKTYAHDAIMGLDRSLNLAAGNNIEAEQYLYMGPADKATRPFCIDRVGKMFTVKEINGMDNGMGLDVWLNGGGWNCRHSWVPVAAEMVGRFEKMEGKWIHY